MRRSKLAGRPWAEERGDAQEATWLPTGREISGAGCKGRGLLLKHCVKAHGLRHDSDTHHYVDHDGTPAHQSGHHEHRLQAPRTMLRSEQRNDGSPASSSCLHFCMESRLLRFDLQ